MNASDIKERTPDLALFGPTPVMYFDQEDEYRDGNGFNVFNANDAIASRFATLDEAIVEFKRLLEFNKETTPVVKYANKHRARRSDDPKFRFYGPGEVVVLDSGPYFEFTDDANLSNRLIHLAFGAGALNAEWYGKYLGLWDKMMKEGDYEGLTALAEELFDVLNFAVEHPEDDPKNHQPDETNYFHWGWHEGTVFFHSMAWWDGTIDGPEGPQ